MGFFDRWLDTPEYIKPYEISIPDDEGTVRYHMTFFGRVQGVGFRYTMQMAASSLGLTGWVHNNADGSVACEVQGPVEKIRLLTYKMQESRYIRIDSIDLKKITPDKHDGNFRVR